MTMSPLYLTESDSIDSLRPVLMKLLETNLCVLVKTNLTKNNTDEINDDLLLWSELLGKDLGTSLEHHILYGTRDKSVLPAHVEGIYNTNGIYSYFTLASIRSPTQGGETRIIYACKAASIIQEEYPHLVNVIFEYSSLAHPDKSSQYKLLTQTKNGRTLLVYRSKVVTNKVLNYQNTSELYSTIDVVLERCIIMSHKWSVGDILFVNNVGTIHDRLPYVGTRKMLRIRFEDKQNILKPLTKKEIR